MSLINKDVFNKSLARLEQMTVNKSQLFHTGSDSQPGSWAGTTPEQESDESANTVDENGTDYASVKKSLEAKVSKGGKLTDAENAIVKGENPLKFIADKISKGLQLTKAESWAVKGGMGMFGAGAKAPVMKATSEDIQDEVSEAGDEAGKNRAFSKIDKSLPAQVKANETLRKSIEMSPFLYELVNAIGAALEGPTTATASVVKSLNGLVDKIAHLEKVQNDNWRLQGEFNKSLGEAVVGLGQAASATADLASQAVSAPARGPMSVVKGGRGQNGVIQKSFTGDDQGQGGLGNIEKSQLTAVLLDLHKSGHVTDNDVIKYESTGQVSDPVIAKARAYLAGNVK